MEAPTFYRAKIQYHVKDVRSLHNAVRMKCTWKEGLSLLESWKKWTDFIGGGEERDKAILRIVQ